VATISRLLKIIGLFCAKEPYKRDNFLQKRPIFLRSLLTVATPYHSVTTEQKGLRHLEGMDCKELTHFIII
jgi:hypothetical protein